MKYASIFLMLVFLFGCEDEIPYFKPSIDYIYNGYFKVWEKKNIIKNSITGEVTINETRDLNLQYIFKGNAILRSTDGGNSFDTLKDFHISMDSITFTYPNNGLHKTYYVTDLYRMKNGDPRKTDISNARDKVNPELKGFYLFLELENKEKISGENSVITEVILLYSEGYAE